MRVLYWFRRDLRLYDNRALAEAYSVADEIIPIYILDEDTIRERGIDLSHRWVLFLAGLLREIGMEIKLHVFIGRTYDIFEELLDRYRFDAVYTVRPLSWSEERLAERVREVCSKLGVVYREVSDNTLVDPLKMELGRSFTSFYEKWIKSIDISTAPNVPAKKFMDIDGPGIEEFMQRIGVRDGDIGDRSLEPSWGRSRLYSFNFESYDKLRDYPYIDGTSRLSHFISLGALSIREVFNVARERSKEFVRQLAWRDYYYTLYARYPWMNRLELKPYMRGFEWENNSYYIECFTKGETGYPIVDAGIRQLKKEGWIHNRVRLVVASFLTKDLLVDWRIGEEFFRKHLIDYDEVLNIGNWQWAASVGVDPLPTRIFNPIIQSEKYDPLCLYIKKYIPELEGYSCKELHNPIANKIRGYYDPIVDHYEQVRKYRELASRKLRK